MSKYNLHWFSFVALWSLEIKKLTAKGKSFKQAGSTNEGDMLLRVVFSNSPKLVLSTLSHALSSLPTVCTLSEALRLISLPSIHTQLMSVELLGGEMSGNFREPNTNPVNQQIHQ